MRGIHYETLTYNDTLNKVPLLCFVRNNNVRGLIDTNL